MKWPFITVLPKYMCGSGRTPLQYVVSGGVCVRGLRDQYLGPLHLTGFRMESAHPKKSSELVLQEAQLPRISLAGNF
jgi:hypothetical protein